LGDWLRGAWRNSRVEAFAVPGDIKLNERTVVQPDVFVIREAGLVERWTPRDTRPEIITERLTSQPRAD